MSNRAPRLDLNPSAADRWTTCTASPKFILDNWDKVLSSDTFFNQEGTTAHEAASAMLQNWEPRVIDKWHCPVPVDADMRWHAWNYMEYVQSLIEPGGKLLVEQKLPLWYMPERNAIVDAAVINPDSLHVIDYKYGEGIIVSPENNLQGAIYAKSVVESMSNLTRFSLPVDFPITVHIYQPRGRAASDSPFHTWQTTWAEINAFSDVATQAATLIQNHSPSGYGLNFVPSEKACQWCPAKGFCPERQKLLTQNIEVLVTIDNAPKHFPPVKAVSVAQLCAIIKHGDQIKKWVSDAQAYALDHLKAGHTLPGYKLVLSRGGNRYWSDPKKAGKLLEKTTVLREDEIYETSVASPITVEKLLGKHKFGKDLMNLIAKSPGKPSIAPDNDPRSAIEGIKGETEFESLE